MAGFGLSCIIIILLALAQGVPLSQVISTVIQDLSGK